jgi:signal transduction histidine kinase
MATKVPPAALFHIRLSGDLQVAAGTIPRKGCLVLRDDRGSSLRTMDIHASADTLGGVQMLESVRARIRAVDPFRADIVLAALFVIAGAIELYFLDSEGHSRPITIAAGVVCLSSLAFRRRDPLIAAVVFSVPILLQAFLDGFLTKNSTTPFAAVILLFFSIGRYADSRQLRLAVPILITSLMVTLAVEAGLSGWEDFFWASFMFGLPVLAGRALRSRALLQAELREKAEQAEHDRATSAHRAVEDERVRIAAELQELVANGLSAMVIQAEAVPRALGAGDSPRAGAAFAAVETTGREALTEMRTLLGVLRRDGDGAELAPQPGLPRVLALVERTREGGLPVEVRIEGREESWAARGGRRLPPGVDLTGYRVVEDAFEAAAEHGATTAELLIRYTPDELRIQVTDDREGGASDRLPALRDRVGLYGGHLSAGRLDEGGFRLRARLPIEVAS